jgi:cysteine synthase
MSKGNSEERARMMRGLGAEVILVDQLPDSQPGYVSGGDLELVAQATSQIVLEHGGFRADQFQNPSNFRAHYLHTGLEILRQAGCPISAFCDFVGSGGTFAGCAARLKEHDSCTQCFIVEPTGCAVLAGNPVSNPRHRIQGGGYSDASLEMIRRHDVDGYVQVTDDQAITTARRLAREEGIFSGFSSGANVAAALKLVPGRTVVTLINDSGLKYLSTELWP